MEELQTICRNREKLNRKLIEKINRVWYWSSTEDDWKNLNGEAVVWYVLMNNGYTSTRVKYNYGYVRAVSAF
ncbi:MAG: hypothetical protein IJZ67_05715 [Alistipes sp.]|nr:hypothetical protein [Alistipes sp.]